MEASPVFQEESQCEGADEESNGYGNIKFEHFVEDTPWGFVEYVAGYVADDLEKVAFALYEVFTSSGCFTGSGAGYKRIAKETAFVRIRNK